jgi:hypothetical protein
VEAFILQEISNSSLYFADEVVTRLNHKGRYDYGEHSEDNLRVSVASYPVELLVDFQLENSVRLN